MVYSHISYNSPTGAYSYYETRRTPFRAPPGSGDIVVSTRSSELTPSGEARRHRTYNYRSGLTSGPYDHKIESWIEPATHLSRSARSASCSRAGSRRSLSRSREERPMTRTERMLQEHIEREPTWIKSKVASIKTDIDRFFDQADQKYEDHRDKDYRSTWVKDEMSSLKNDIQGFRDHVSSSDNQIKRLEDCLNVQTVKYDQLAPRCVDCGRRSESVSRFHYVL
ncbi:unnamed protein product [Meganyctiphanes norvegica]|uniref:Uncharacterized protein n=1 Tax=Meganyctiphanes norvegica TaxID=48144 RepID=A0AAV2RND6_MEGNR